MDTEDRVSLVYETRGAEQAVAEHTAVAAAQTKMADAQVRIGRTGSEAAAAHHKVREGLHAMAGALGFINPELDIFVHLMQSTKIAAFGVSDALELVAGAAKAMWSAVANPIGLAFVATLLTIKATMELVADATERAKERQDALNASMKAGQSLTDNLRDAEKKRSDGLVETANDLIKHGGQGSQAEATRRAASEAVIGSGGRYSMKEALDTATSMAALHRGKPITAAEINQFTGLGRELSPGDPAAERNIEEAQADQRTDQIPGQMKVIQRGERVRFLRAQRAKIKAELDAGFFPQYEGEQKKGFWGEIGAFVTEKESFGSNTYHESHHGAAYFAAKRMREQQMADLDRNISAAEQTNRSSVPQMNITNSIIYQREHPLVGPSPSVGPPQ